MNGELIKDFVAGIAVELENSIDEDIDFSVLEKYKNILIIRSAKIEYFESLRKRLSSKCGISRFYLVGDSDDYNSEYYKNNVIQLYAHQNRIDDQFLLSIKKIKEIKKVEAILYLSYEIFRPTYLNVLKLANEISADTGADIYAYQVKEETLTHLKDPKLIQYGIETFPCIVDVSNYLLEKEDLHEN